jgi:hypothetical protein
MTVVLTPSIVGSFQARLPTDVSSALSQSVPFDDSAGPKSSSGKFAAEGA